MRINPMPTRTGSAESRVIRVSPRNLRPIALPVPPPPVGNYRRGVVRRGIGCLSGQLPLENGNVRYAGLVGVNLSVDSGYAAARLAGLNALAQIRELLAGFERLDGLLRLDGLVACSPMFTEHATVLNGASDLFVEVLGDRGWHARSAAGVISLPMNAAVELVVTFAISDAACRVPQFDCRGHWDRCYEDFGTV
jgi:enamine deaminase RidA (YjgF/YER057c/UK114 family)